MTQFLFMFTLSCFTFLYLYWGFTHLTQERLQFFAAIPHRKQSHGSWRGVNFTWYGLLSANSVLLSAALFMTLASAVGVPSLYALLLLLILLGALFPSARWIAKRVEKKRHTFTIGGAVFAGMLMAPSLIFLLNRVLPWMTGFSYPAIETLSALSLAYTFGESLGRLSCISFGCCYGKPVSESPALFHNFFQDHNFIFSGQTRKACYASHLDGVKTIPIQAVTSVIYAISALLGLLLFLIGLPQWALFETLIITQLWRLVSEFFREDFRGKEGFSAYQAMASIAVLFTLLMLPFFPTCRFLHPDITIGLLSLWRPLIILTLQSLWIATFIYMGRSTITFSLLSFHVNDDFDKSNPPQSP